MLDSYFESVHPDTGPVFNAAPPANVGTPTIIVDRCALFREGLTQALAGTAFTVVAAEADLREVRLGDDPHGLPLLVILASSSDNVSDVRALKNAHARFPNSVLVLLCRECLPRQAALMLRAGAAAILPVPHRPDGISDVLELVMLGQHVVPLHLMASCIGFGDMDVDEALESTTSRPDLRERGTKLSRLSTRETDIMRCLLAGEPNRLIARRLAICEATVKVHVKAILRKIKVKNRTQAAIWAASNLDASGRPTDPPTRPVQRLSA
jgi:two-component system nitrate/nitrite response regulator NarL